MVRKPVKSSNIVSVGHDPETRKMQVEFQGGSVYEYDNVGEDDYNSFVHDRSPGGHFAQHIRPKFKGTKLTS